MIWKCHMKIIISCEFRHQLPQASFIFEEDKRCLWAPRRIQLQKHSLETVSQKVQVIQLIQQFSKNNHEFLRFTSIIWMFVLSFGSMCKWYLLFLSYWETKGQTCNESQFKCTVGWNSLINMARKIERKHKISSTETSFSHKNLLAGMKFILTRANALRKYYVI